MSKQKAIIKHYSMPESIARLIDILADKTGMNKSELVREAVRHYARYLEVKEYDY